MKTKLDNLTAEARALQAYLTMQEGFPLDHRCCMEAIAAMHCYSNWDELMLHERFTPSSVNFSIESLPLEQAAQNLTDHLQEQYDLRINDAAGAVAAIRRGTIVEQLRSFFGDALTIRHWLRRRRSIFRGLCADDILATDAGYGLVQTTLSKLI